MAQGGNYEVTLQKQIPVHITYFTAMVGDDGQVKSFADIYGHDNRVSCGAGWAPAAAGAAADHDGGRQGGRPAGWQAGRQTRWQAGAPEAASQQQRRFLGSVRELVPSRSAKRT